MTAARADKLKALFITVGGVGHLRPFPGTWGSLASVLAFAAIWWLLAALRAPPWSIEIVGVAGIVVSSWLSVRWGTWALHHYNSHDPKPFVLDEFAGQWVALLWLPAAAEAGFWPWTLVVGGQFLLFRVLDILKPPPARQLEHLPAGWGVLCDDLMAGLYAAVVGQLVWRLSPLVNALGPVALTAAGVRAG